MTPLEEFMEVLVKTAEQDCNLECRLSLKELSEENSLYAELGTGFTNDTYYDKSTVKTFPVLFLCRDTDQARCLGQLAAICDHLQRRKTYPAGETFRWLDAMIAKEPSKIGRDEDGTYHYSCILNCKLFY